MVVAPSPSVLMLIPQPTMDITPVLPLPISASQPYLMGKNNITIWYINNLRQNVRAGGQNIVINISSVKAVAQDVKDLIDSCLIFFFLRNTRKYTIPINGLHRAMVPKWWTTVPQTQFYGQPRSEYDN